MSTPTPVPSGRYCLQNSKSGGYLNQDTSSGQHISNVQVWSNCAAPESQWELVLLDESQDLYALQNVWSGNWLNEDIDNLPHVHVWKKKHKAPESQWRMAMTAATECTLQSSRSGSYQSSSHAPSLVQSSLV